MTMAQSTCANCNNTSSFNFTSLLTKIDPSNSGVTVMEVITELFGVSEEIRCLVDAFQEEGDVPQLCPQCSIILKNCYEFKRHFLSLCHPKATLGSILIHPADLGDHTQNETQENCVVPKDEVLIKTEPEEPQDSKFRLKECSVVIGSLPHIYYDCNTEVPAQLLQSTIKIESASTIEAVTVGEMESGSWFELEVEPSYFQNLNKDDDSNPNKIESTQKYNCEEEGCNAQFPFQAKMLVHMSTTHLFPSGSTIEEFQCPLALCDFKTKHKHSLSAHCFAHTKENMYKCDVPGCNYLAPSMCRLKRHHRVHEDSHMRRNIKRKGTQQDVPEKRFKEDILSASYEKIQPESSVFKCESDNCKETFAFRAELMSHVAMDHLSDQVEDAGIANAKAKCPDCNFQSKFQFEFTSHMFNHTGENQYKCLRDDCRFECAGSLDMRNHCLLHFIAQSAVNHTSGKETIPYTCQVCSKSFNDNDNLKQHIRSHTLPNVCPSCGKGFAHPRYLRRHLENIHSDGVQLDVDKTNPKTPVSKFKCRTDGCQKIFAFHASLLAHMIKEHIPRPQGQDNLQCTLCDYSTKKMGALSLHILKHTNERKDHCKIQNCSFEGVPSFRFKRQGQGTHNGHDDGNLGRAVVKNSVAVVHGKGTHGERFQQVKH